MAVTAKNNSSPDPQHFRDEGKITSVFSDFRRACPGRNHNWPATGEGENPFPLSFRLA